MTNKFKLLTFNNKKKEPVLARCWLFHQWGKWQEVTRGNIVRHDAYGQEQVKGWYIRQERVCSRCGYRQVTVEKSNLL